MQNLHEIQEGLINKPNLERNTLLYEAVKN